VAAGPADLDATTTTVGGLGGVSAPADRAVRAAFDPAAAAIPCGTSSGTTPTA
jgi:hypothetical protein